METFKAKYREVTWRWRYKKHRSKENISQIITEFSPLTEQRLRKVVKKMKRPTSKVQDSRNVFSISLLHTWITLKSSWNSPKLYRCDDVARLISGKQDVVTIWAKNWKHRE